MHSLTATIPLTGFTYITALAASSSIVAVGGWKDSQLKVSVYDATTFHPKYELVNPDSLAYTDYAYGAPLAASDEYLVVGGPQENPQDQSGSVWIHSAQTGELLRVLHNPDLGATGSGYPDNYPEGDWFGSALCLDGDSLYVGASGEDHEDGDEEWGRSIGIVYVFNVTTGALLDTILNPNLHDSPHLDKFGSRIVASTTKLFVTAYGDVQLEPVQGLSFVFNKSNRNFIAGFTSQLLPSEGYSAGIFAQIAANDDYLVVPAAFSMAYGVSSPLTMLVASAETGIHSHTIHVEGETINTFVDAVLSQDRLFVIASKVLIYNVVTGELLQTLESTYSYGPYDSGITPHHVAAVSDKVYALSDNGVNVYQRNTPAFWTSLRFTEEIVGA